MKESPVREWQLPVESGAGAWDAGNPAVSATAERLHRRVMDSLTSAVAVVTARDVDAVPVGTTTSALSAVSRSPPVLLVCIPQGVFAAGAIRRAGAFAVNVLGADAEPLARRFAARSGRFDGIDSVVGRLGIPLLSGSLAIAECEVIGLQRICEQLVVFGRIVAGEAREGAPLLRRNGDYVAWPGQEGTAEGSA
jgi:flavin reductase (DIM6/NTAB) family NADH-FMN oxidoreductase RutF